MWFFRGQTPTRGRSAYRYGAAANHGWLQVRLSDIRGRRVQRLFHLLWICRLKAAIASKKGGGRRKRRKKKGLLARASTPRQNRRGVNTVCVCVHKKHRVCVCAPAIVACVAGLQQSGRLFEIVYVGPDPYGQISGGGVGGG